MERLPAQKKGYKSETDRRLEEEAEKKAKGPVRKPAVIKEREDGLLDVTLSLNHFYSPMDEKVLIRALLAQEGVSECTAVYRAGEVRFVLDPSKNTVEALEEVCTGLSYPPGEGLDGFWLDVACAIALLGLYIAIGKWLASIGYDQEWMSAYSPLIGILLILAGIAVLVIGLKMLGVHPAFEKLKIGFIDNIPRHYNKWVWKIGAVLLVLAGVLAIGYGGFTFY